MKIEFYVYLIEDAQGNVCYDVCKEAAGPVSLKGRNTEGEEKVLIGVDTDQAWRWAKQNGFKLRTWRSTFQLMPGADDEKAGSGRIERLS